MLISGTTLSLSLSLYISLSLSLSLSLFIYIYICIDKNKVVWAKEIGGKLVLTVASELGFTKCMGFPQRFYQRD